MSTSLLDSSSSDEESDKGHININQAYATSYNRFREKELFQKLKDKFGEETARKKLDDELEEEDSISESEDEDADELTEEVEKEFFTTLSCLKGKDPRIYDERTTFFRRHEASRGNGKKTVSKGDEPMFLNDLQRKIVVEKGGTFDGMEDPELEAKACTKSYAHEMDELKKSFKEVAELSDEGDDSDEVLVVKNKSKSERTKEDLDYKEWLMGQKEALDDPTTENDLKGLRDHWGREDLDDGERFLRNYILNKGYLERDSSECEEEDDKAAVAYDLKAHNSDDNLEADQRNIEKQEEFEHKFNFRFEEPDPEFIKRYPRTIEGSMRRKKSTRKEQREATRRRKLAEKEKRQEELKQLKALKRKEIMEKIEKLQKTVFDKNTRSTIVDFKPADLEDDFDPGEYDKRMAEMFSDYTSVEAVAEETEKPVFSDLSDFEDLQEENWDEWTGEASEDKEVDECHAEEEKSIEYSTKAVMQRELVRASFSRGALRKKKSKFAEMLEVRKPTFDPTTRKTFQQYLDEYYCLDYEDVIGDLPCRFKYRKVVPNNFGLSTGDVLSAPDRELNAWCSLKKTCLYRSDADELKDKEEFRHKALNHKLKAKLLPSLFDADAVDGGALEIEHENKSSRNKKKRERKKRKMQEQMSNTFEEGADKDKSETSSDLNREQSQHASKRLKKSDDAGRADKKAKRKKRNRTVDSDPIEDLNNCDGGVRISTHLSTSKKFKKPVSECKSSSNKKKKVDVNADLKISDERLQAYGIAPAKFKRRIRKQTYAVGLVK